MINGVKLSLVFHFYCRSVEDVQIGNGNIYNELHRRCLTKYHSLFDESIFCVVVDNPNDRELIRSATDWILSCGFGKGTIIKVKENSPYWDAKTFYDEIIDHLDDYEGMVFFAHGKGAHRENLNGLKQWIAFSYYSCLDRIDEYMDMLVDDRVVVSYVPITTKFAKPNEWYPAGSFLLLNPAKIASFPQRFGMPLPKLSDRFSTEYFIPRIIDINNAPFGYYIQFENWTNGCWIGNFNYYEQNHIELLQNFLNESRLEQYISFYDQITNGLPL